MSANATEDYEGIYHFPYTCIEVSNGIVISYPNINSRKTAITFLFDYNKKLIQDKLYDPQLLYWQVENSMLLKQMGLNFNFIKKQLDAKNKNYHKYENLLSQMTYRLVKHGQLAPLKEISRPIDESKLSFHPTDSSHKKPTEINYYNQNDSFIDDADAFSGEENDGFFKLNLTYGNYSEDDIIRNLNRNKTRIKKKKSKKKETLINEDEVGEEECDINNNVVMTTDEIAMMSTTGNGLNTEVGMKIKKRKFGERISVLPQSGKIEKEAILNLYNELMNEYCEFGNDKPLTSKEKEHFIKKIMPSIKNIDVTKDENTYDNFIDVFTEKLNIDKCEFKLLFEYELFKSKIEGRFSTFSKRMNIFISYLNDNNIKDFTNINSIISNDNNMKVKFDDICLSIFAYIHIYNTYFQKIENKDEYTQIMEKYIPNIKERDDDYVHKIHNKLKEYFEKYDIKINLGEVITYIKKNYEEKEGDDYCVSIEMFFKDEDKENEYGNKNAVVKDCKEEDTKMKSSETKTKGKMQKKSKKGNEEEKEKGNEQGNKKKKSSGEGKGNKKISKLDGNNSGSVTKENKYCSGYTIQMKPLLSCRYYVCQFSSDHFI